MKPSEVGRHAATMLALWDESRLQAPASAEAGDFDTGAAYEIAGEAMRRREAAGWRRAGRKIGFTNGEVMRRYGMAMPIFGYLYDRTLSHADGDRASVAVEGLVQAKIEPEIVFCLRSSPPATRDPIALLGSVEWLALGFELVQCHYPEWRFDAPDAIADGGLHGRYVAGRPAAVEPDAIERLAEELAAFRVELVRDGEVVAEGGGANVLESPLNALAYLVEVLAGLPGHPPLAAGEIVTSGTLTDALPIAAGEVWTTRVSGLPVAPVTLRLV